MQEIIKKVYNEKLNDGTIEKIVSDKIDEMVKSCCDDLFTWCGPIKKQMKEKLGEVMSTVVENSDFSQYVQKLTYIINQVLPETALEDYKNIGKAIEETCGSKALSYKDTVKLSDIFKAYCDYVEKETFNEYDFDDDDELHDDYDNGGKYTELTLKMKVDDYIKFYIDDSYTTMDTKEREKYTFSLKKWKNSVSYYKEIPLSKLRYISQFEMYLIMLSNNSVRIEFDCYNEECEVECHVEE